MLQVTGKTIEILVDGYQRHRFNTTTSSFSVGKGSIVDSKVMQHSEYIVKYARRARAMSNVMLHVTPMPVIATNTLYNLALQVNQQHIPGYSPEELELGLGKEWKRSK